MASAPNKGGQEHLAVVALADAVEVLGLRELLVDELVRRRDIRLEDTTESLRLQERREKWRGDERENSECLDRISMGEDGESFLLDQMGDDMWRRFRKKLKPKKRQEPQEEESLEE